MLGVSQYTYTIHTKFPQFSMYIRQKSMQVIINTKCIPYIQNAQLRFPKLSNVYPKHTNDKNDKFSLVISESIICMIKIKIA